MFGWLTQAIASITAAMTFLGIFLVGVVFSALSLVLGGHGDGDHDFGHETDHDTDHDHGSEHHGENGESSIFSVGMFSMRGIILLTSGFGGIGFLVQVSTGKVFFSTAAGIVGGYVFAFIVLYALKIFKSQQANSLIELKSAVGIQGVVTVSIPSTGVGEVRLTVSGMEMSKTAVSKNGVPIRSGTPVRVEEVNGSTLVVTS
jgi:hypothetical protein